MDLNAGFVGRYIRVVAIVALLLGLNDASRLLGVASGSISPVVTLGVTGFTFLAIFSLSMLFAAVGLWIKASWGAVLLAAATATELAMFMSGSRDVQMTPFGFAIRLVLLASVVIIFILAIRTRRSAAHD